MKKIRVLIVDDSLMFREFLKRAISSDENLEVVAVASDPYEARDKIIEFEPDVMTLDIELPRMDGIQFLKKLIPQYPIPVIVISAVNKSVFEVLNAGAVDFIPKPSGNLSVESFAKELVTKVKIASIAKINKFRVRPAAPENTENIENKNRFIFIGASTGGTEAIFDIIKKFPKDMPPTLIVQHMPAVFTRMYAERLNDNCQVEVMEAKDGDLVLPGRVLIAAGEYHMKLVKEAGTYKVRCFRGEKVNGHCPSIDVLFNSAAEIIKDKAIGIILTGMGYDGAKGLLNMRKLGARTIGQDEKSSIVYGMPKVAYEIGAVEFQRDLNLIHQIIFSILNERH
ncbi:MAG: chemotaxis response regulator protein-glutamate methylesterase [Bacillota bacterium]|nr:chemotaxis response regulator protein-glutamate methylesterase [Bacillota bacterium]